MRACWRDERASFQGRFFNIPEVGLAPKPARGTIPIWIGGHTPRALRRVAELGDGWHAAFAASDVMRKGLADLKDACAKIGRNPAELTLSVRMGLSARRPVQEVVDEIKALRDTGVRHIIIETRLTALDDMTQLLDRFTNDIRAKL